MDSKAYTATVSRFGDGIVVYVDGHKDAKAHRLADALAAAAAGRTVLSEGYSMSHGFMYRVPPRT